MRFENLSKMKSFNLCIGLFLQALLIVLLCPIGSIHAQTQRTTVSGKQCVFPTTYRGETLTDCTDIGGVSKCKTSTGLWETCAQSGGRTTVTGKDCVFPTTYRGETLTDCTDIGGASKCKTAMGLWEECAAPGTTIAPPTAPAMPPASSTGGRMTVSGRQCVFPTTYRGETLTDCTVIGGVSKCKTSIGIWEECTAVASASARMTVNGNQCVFPVTYRGETLLDCTDISGRQKCKTSKGLWEDCVPSGTSGRVTVSGKVKFKAIDHGTPN